MYNILDIASEIIITVTEEPTYDNKQKAWVTGNRQIVDIKKEFTIEDLNPVAELLPALSPIEFMLLFTQPERKALRTIKSSDEVMEDWMILLEDPRLTGVDLNLPVVQSVIDYMVFAGLLTAERAVEVKAGQMPA